MAAHLKQDHWKEFQQMSQDEQRKNMHAEAMTQVRPCP